MADSADNSDQSVNKTASAAVAAYGSGITGALQLRPFRIQQDVTKMEVVRVDNIVHIV